MELGYQHDAHVRSYDIARERRGVWGREAAITVLTRAKWTPREIALIIDWTTARVERELTRQATIRRKKKLSKGKPVYTPGLRLEYNTELGSLEISIRAMTALASLGVETIAELRKRWRELEEMKGVGSITLKEIELELTRQLNDGGD